jgi:cobalt/nickel transport system permease protein
VASTFADPRRDRALLLAWLAAAFALSAVTDLRVLGAAAAAALLLFRRGLARNLARTARSVVPISVGLSALSWGFLWLVRAAPPPLEPFAALSLRTGVIAFLSFAVLDRVDLLRALAPWPAATRMLVVTLAQIHALRLLAVESRLGLRSRLPRRPRTGEVVRSAGAITGTLVVLSGRNARDVADALRARGF